MNSGCAGDCWCRSWAEKRETAGAAGMLEPLRNPASWDNFRKVVVLVLILWTAVSAVLCIIYFFILGAAALRRRTYSGRLFCLSPLSLRPIAGLAQVQEPGSTGGEAGGGRGLGQEAMALTVPAALSESLDAVVLLFCVRGSGSALRPTPSRRSRARWVDMHGK